MNWFPPRPLGTRIPNRLHAVSVSLPALRDVVGYEEKDPAVVRRLSSGYPRFVVHPTLVAIECAWRQRFDLAGRRPVLWMVSSRRMAEWLRDQLGPKEAAVLEHDGVFAVAHREDPELRKRAKILLQHTGGFLSSRQAEDYAVLHGLTAAAEPEQTAAEDSARLVRKAVARAFGAADPDSVLLAASGMNAFWASFRALLERGRSQGRDRWLQIGWLYLDTAAILEKFTGGGCIQILDPNDDAAIAAVFREHGQRLAAVVTETPTNPAIETANLPLLADLSRRAGTILVADPSVAWPGNVDVLPYCDLALASLTKYAAHEGDVIAGGIVVSPRCPDAAALHAAIAAELEPVYPRDLARLAAQIGRIDELLPRFNANARALADYLSARRGVRRLCWSLQERSRTNYLRLARRPDCIAPMLSFEVEGSMAAFYDAVPMAKGPSFGMQTSLLSPFVYLAHYDLVTSPAGQELLKRAGLSPDLLRLGVGIEPVEALIDALECGFRAAGW